MNCRHFVHKLFQKKTEIECSTFYYQNGTSSIGYRPLETLSNRFFIEVYGNSAQRVVYEGDSIMYELEDALRELQYSFRRLIFPDDGQYYVESKNLPILVNEAGMSSDSCVSKESFEKMLKLLGNTANYNRHMYFADVVYLINSISNLIIGLEANFIDFFRLLSETTSPRVDKNGTFVVYGQHSEHVISVLGSYYIKLYSILDLLTKITYEFEHPHTRFDTYPRLSCNGMLYNAKKRLRVNDTPNTLFDKDESITEIETIRNEIVHNGMWEGCARLFVTLNKREHIERFVLYPDMSGGRFVAYGNRHHFFSAGTKVNDILPGIHREFLVRLKNSIKVIMA